MDIGMDDVAEDHVSHLFGFDVRPLDCLADHGCAQFGRGLVLQTATKGPDGGTHAAEDHNFWLCHVLSFSFRNGHDETRPTLHYTSSVLTSPIVSSSSLARTTQHA